MNIRPLKGEFTIFAGLWDCLALLENFHYSDSDIAYLRTVLPSSVEDEFFTFLQALTPQEVKVYALPEGENWPINDDIQSRLSFW